MVDNANNLNVKVNNISNQFNSIQCSLNTSPRGRVDANMHPSLLPKCIPNKYDYINVDSTTKVYKDNSKKLSDTIQTEAEDVINQIKGGLGVNNIKTPRYYN